MFAELLVTICVMTTDGNQCREFRRETTATIEECEEVIEAYEMLLVGQFISNRIPISSLDAQCVIPGEDA